MLRVAWGGAGDGDLDSGLRWNDGVDERPAFLSGFATNH